MTIMTQEQFVDLIEGLVDLNDLLSKDLSTISVRDAILAITRARGDAAPVDAKGVPVFGIRRDSDAAVVDDGDFALLHMDEEGRAKVATKPASVVAINGVANTVAATVVADVRRASHVVFHVKNIGTVTLAAGTFVFEGSVDSTNGTDGTWFGIQAVRSNANTIETQIALSGITAGAGYAASWEASVNGYSWMRLRCSVAVTASASASWTIQRGSYATEPIPAAQISGTQPVSGSVTATTTPATGTAYNLITAATTNAAVIKASAGNLMALNISNPTATAAFVKLYNKASAPTVGTDIPTMTFRIAATGTVGDMLSLNWGLIGERFSTGIALAVTAAAVATDTGATVAGIQIHGTYV
jgi:hypothetical protein